MGVGGVSIRVRVSVRGRDKEGSKSGGRMDCIEGKEGWEGWGEKGKK